VQADFNFTKSNEGHHEGDQDIQLKKTSKKSNKHQTNIKEIFVVEKYWESDTLLAPLQTRMIYDQFSITG
jgi:hypothetical protein